MHTNHSNIGTSTRLQNTITPSASVEHQLELFSTAPVEPATPTAPVQSEPQKWPSNIMLHHPDDESLSWHGRGRAPAWAAIWAAENGITGYAEEIRTALLAANQLEVSA